MSICDGRVHIGLGLYLGYVVAWIGNYSTFLAAGAGFAIVSYYTTETFHHFINAVAIMFYNRVLARTIEKFINDAAVHGIGNLITTSIMFIITGIKYICASRTTQETIFNIDHGFQKTYAPSQTTMKIEEVTDISHENHLDTQNSNPETLVMTHTQDLSKPPTVVIRRKQ